MKKCYFCRGRIVKRKVSHVHRWGKKIILFEDMPAEVCEQCGEIYFSPDTLEMMDKATREVSSIKKSIKVPVATFGELVHAE
jgi:YgiT-type zinc finger domain-containing protein